MNFHSVHTQHERDITDNRNRIYFVGKPINFGIFDENFQFSNSQFHFHLHPPKPVRLMDTTMDWLEQFSRVFPHECGGFE